MLNNQEFTADRSQYLGGSDIGAILGLSKYRTALQVWMEKTNKEVEKVDSLPLRFGSFAEEFVAREYARATSFELLHDESLHIHSTHAFMGAHIDRFVFDAPFNSTANAARKLPNRILECKTANPFTANEWGDVGSDQVPMSYLCQCIWYMAITGIERADIATLFGNSDFRIYQIHKDLELESLILEKATHFWDNYVLADIPPPTQTEADCQTLFAKGNANASAEADQETCELSTRLHLLNQEIEVREAEISSIKQAIMTQMGEAELLTYQGKVLATWRSPKPSYRLDSKRLEAEHPEWANQYKIPVQNSRRLVIKDLSL